MAHVAGTGAAEGKVQPPRGNQTRRLPSRTTPRNANPPCSSGEGLPLPWGSPGLTPCPSLAGWTLHRPLLLNERGSPPLVSIVCAEKNCAEYHGIGSVCSREAWPHRKLERRWQGCMGDAWEREERHRAGPMCIRRPACGAPAYQRRGAGAMISFLLTTELPRTPKEGERNPSSHLCPNHPGRGQSPARRLSLAAFPAGARQGLQIKAWFILKLCFFFFATSYSISPGQTRSKGVIQGWKRRQQG